ncbi:hypothetical protein CY652_16750 [Burkholderia sp. WAC0059]|nr:hypothetical protein CY652_16750 [Burkholderia sp. WAC0059]
MLALRGTGNAFSSVPAAGMDGQGAMPTRGVMLPVSPHGDGSRMTMAGEVRHAVSPCTPCPCCHVACCHAGCCNFHCSVLSVAYRFDTHGPGNPPFPISSDPGRAGITRAPLLPPPIIV